MPRDTSIAAAESIAELTPQLRARVFEEIRLREGATCDELEISLDLKHQTASARVHELMKEGKIVDSGERRPTSSGAMAIVWKVTPPSTSATVVGPSRQSKQEVVVGDCVEVLKTIKENSVDAIVCDPPYGLSSEPDAAEVLRHWLAGDDYQHRGGGFMGKSWDSFVPGPAIWRECLRVLKPGGHMLAFGGTRTSDLLSIAIRLAGFEIRDTLQWLYGTGFPKSLDVSKAITAGGGPESIRRLAMGDAYEPSGRGRVNYDHGSGSAMNGTTNPVDLSDAAKQWQGWGTALKPAYEPVILARKPLDGTVAANVQRWGTGAINVDGCRIATDEKIAAFGSPKKSAGGILNGTSEPREQFEQHAAGRWPANVLLDETVSAMLDKQSGERTSGDLRPYTRRKRDGYSGGMPAVSTFERKGDFGGASRFFYCAKASTAERERGLDHLPRRSAGELTDREDGTDGLKSPRAGAGRGGGRANVHPTVKPIALMRWLLRLVTPPGGIVIDPFAGSGSTGVAAVHEDVNCILIEREKDYATIAEARISHAKKQYEKIDANASLLLNQQTQTQTQTQTQAQTETQTEADVQTETQGDQEMANLPPNIAKQVADARVTGGGTYIEHGDYDLMVTKWDYQELQNKVMIHEFLVINAKAKQVKEGEKVYMSEPNPVDSACSYVVDFDGAGKLSAPGNVRAVVLGLFGFKENDVSGDVVQKTLSDCVDGKANGMILRCSTFPKEIKSKRGEFITGMNWDCYATPGQGANRLDLAAERMRVLKEKGAEAAAALARQHMGSPSTEAPSVPAAVPAPVPAPAPSVAAPPPPPSVPAPPAVEKPWLVGWTIHPQDSRYYYKGTDVKTEEDIRRAAGM